MYFLKFISLFWMSIVICLILSTGHCHIFPISPFQVYIIVSSSSISFSAYCTLSYLLSPHLVFVLLFVYTWLLFIPHFVSASPLSSGPSVRDTISATSQPLTLMPTDVNHSFTHSVWFVVLHFSMSWFGYSIWVW